MTWLYVDQGNSRIKWRIVRGETLQEGVSTRPGELAASLKRNRLWPEGIALASVADDARQQQWQAAFPGCDFWVARVQKKLGGLKVAYAQPETLGVDRWLAMAGGWQRCHGQAFAVIDAGTAITLDAVSSRGDHLGGWIAPGVGLLKMAVDAGMARVQSAEPDLTGGLGSSTPECVAMGLGAQLAGLIHQAESALSEHAIRRILITGGDALILMGASSGQADFIHVPDLVLEGLEWAHKVGMPE